MTRGWKKLHNEGLHNLYCSADIVRMIKSRRMRWAEHVAFMEEMRNVCKISVGKPEGEKMLVRSRHGCKDIKMDLRETGWRVCIGFFWLRIGTGGRLSMNLQVPYKQGIS
jgi:hypothetical protein